MQAVWTTLTGVLGALLLLWATEGAQAFTSEAARRLEIERHPRPLPRVELEDRSGRVFTNREMLGSTWVVGFIYTQCGDICPRLTREFSELRAVLDERSDEHERSDERGETGPVKLLSVSFDPERDTPEQLARYGQHFGPDPNTWRFARIEDPAQLASWLETFGIVVIPDRTGGFEHNAALHVIDPRGRLIAVRDLGDLEGVLRLVSDVR